MTQRLFNNVICYNKFEIRCGERYTYYIVRHIHNLRLKLICWLVGSIIGSLVNWLLWFQNSMEKCIVPSNIHKYSLKRGNNAIKSMKKRTWLVIEVVIWLMSYAMDGRNCKNTHTHYIHTFGSAFLKQEFKLNARTQPSPAGYKHFRIIWRNVKWISLSSLNDSCKPTKSILPSGKMKPISCSRQSM